MTKPLAFIIDDDRDTVALYRHVLDIAGYNTEIILRGEIAIARLEKTTPDIILLDLNLPGIPGTKILDAIRADERLADIPVVIITGYAHMVEELQSESDLILIKPVSIDQLSTLVLRFKPTNTKIATNPPRDKLTGLYNRSFFISRLQYSHERAIQLGENLFSVIFIDIHDKKAIQEQGAAFEDELLVKTATSLKSLIRPIDTIAKFGSTQFLILLEDLNDVVGPIRVADRILEELLSLFQNDFEIPLVVYIGLTFGGSDYSNIKEILQQVDIASYHASLKGENQFELYNTTLHQKYILPENYRKIRRLNLSPESDN